MCNLRAADNQIKSLAQDNIVDINMTEGAAASSGDESEGMWFCLRIPTSVPLDTCKCSSRYL